MNLLNAVKQAKVPVAGYYYLHINGDLIFKKFEPEKEPGGFIKEVWPVLTDSRQCAWIICIEALALGARKERVQELATKWGLTNEDAQEFAKRVGLRVFKDEDKFCATFKDFINLQESQAAFGNSALEALALLARQGLTGKDDAQL